MPQRSHLYRGPDSGREGDNKGGGGGYRKGALRYCCALYTVHKKDK